jgi:signal transduction histidine kinase
MTVPELRADAAELLTMVAKDLESPQTRREQRRKSKGRGTAHRMAAAARGHALRRLQAGFHLVQVHAEYRALRASVIRLWARSTRPTLAARRDLIRFNEAIDEALFECLRQYVAEVDQYRDRFVGVLGHDLRNPLAAILMSATSLARAKETDDKALAIARRILGAAQRMDRMVTDLLDATRARLGEGLRIAKGPTDLGRLCREVIDELAVAHPRGRLILECGDDLAGTWDSDRLEQIISNLVGNALQHGDPSKPVTVRAASRDRTATLTVHNHGRTIPGTTLGALLDPMARSPKMQSGPRAPANLGLGLFIVRELVNAHGGAVRVTSTEGDGTTFVVTLPRREDQRKRRPAGSAQPHAHRRARVASAAART